MGVCIFLLNCAAAVTAGQGDKWWLSVWFSSGSEEGRLGEEESTMYMAQKAIPLDQ